MRDRLKEQGLVSIKKTVGEHSLSGYGPVNSVNRLVRPRIPGGVGRGREKLPLTRLGELTDIITLTNMKP